MDRAGVSGNDVDEVLMGCVLQAGIGQAPARQASKTGGLSNAVPCTTINKVCGSGMKAAMMAAQAIKAGDADLIVAGGMESMSNAPYASLNGRGGFRMGNQVLTDLMISDGLWDPYNNCHMGTCGDATAAELGFTREQLDAFAAESLARAIAAQSSGKFAEEIVPCQSVDRKGNVSEIDSDEQPSKGNPSKLPSLRPAFNPNGVTTAGNASSINDGAAALVIASQDYCDRAAAQPIGWILDYCQFAQEPERFTTAPASAIQSLLKRNDLTVADIDLFEVNEAFAVVAMGVSNLVGIPSEKLNVNGGAVALGHPIGMTGARLILTALFELRRRGGGRAICSPCIGGGEATAVLIEV